MTIIGIVLGALVALLVYAVGTAITDLKNEDLIWGIVAVLVWIVVAMRGDDLYARTRR